MEQPARDLIRAVRRPTAGTADLLESARDALTEWRMLDGVSRLAVGLSGGADSLALLDVLVRYGEAHGPFVDLVPIHIHQYPASQDADRLADFVRDRYSLELHVARVDTTSRATPLAVAGKAPCRVCAPVRAEALARECRRQRADALALGHHLDDAVATLMMNVFHRGAIDTMRPVARRRQDFKLPILRPLIFVREADVKANSPVGGAGLFDCGMCSLHARERLRISQFVSAIFAQHDPAAGHAANALRSIFPSPR